MVLEIFLRTATPLIFVATICPLIEILPPLFLLLKREVASNMALLALSQCEFNDDEAGRQNSEKVNDNNRLCQYYAVVLARKPPPTSTGYYLVGVALAASEARMTRE